MGRGLELDDRIVFQRREWIFQRAGWLLMALVVASGAAGLFGDGPLSKAEKNVPGTPWTLRYERFIQEQTESVLTVRTTGAGPLTVWISQSYLDDVAIERTMPASQGTSGSDGVYYAFGEGPAQASIFVKPKKPGNAKGRIGSAPALSVRFRQFVYP